MPTTDLFGNIIPDKTPEEEYKEYIASARWRLKREQALRRAEWKCEVCGLSKWTVKLDVHHLTYEHFKHERPEDLMVVCEGCHEKKDSQRRQHQESKNRAALWDARFHGWAEKVFGEHYDLLSPDYVDSRFEEWLRKKGEL